MRTVEVFKTDIQTPVKAKVIVSVLSKTFPSFKINVDLDDADKILRVQGENVKPELIAELLKAKGYQCEALV